MFGSVCLLVAIYGCVAELKSGCNQTVTLNETETTVTLSDFKLNSTTCTWRLEADKVTSTIVVHVVFVRLTGSLDRVVALDGPYTNRSVIKQCGFECTLNDSLMVSSGNTMLFITELDENPDIRIVSVKAWAQENGGRYNNNGNISVKNGTSSKAYFQLHSTNNNQVQVLLKESTLSPGSLIQIYDGSSETDQTLAILSSSTDFVPITSSKQDLLIVTSNIVGQQYLFGDFSTVQPGCHVVSSGQSGDFILARNNFKSQCDWLINPSLYAGNIMLEIRSVDLCENENLVIYEGLSTFGQKLATVTKATGSTSFPKFTASAGKGLSVFLSAFVNCTSDVPFSGSYWIVPECSADLQTSGIITSPQYPSQYPLNAVCTWPAPTRNTTSSFYMTFNNLDLAIGHNVTVKNDLTTLMIYTGSDLPSDLVTQVKNSSTISIVFDSNTGSLGTGLEKPGRGFNLSYQVLDCGDSFNSNNGRIESKSAIPADAKECIWVLTVPPKSGKSVNIVSFIIDIAGIANWQNLELRDGCSVRSPLLNQGVSMVKTLSFLTRYNKLWIHYRRNATGSGDMADKLFSFNLTYNTYSCDENHVCKNGICLHPDWRCNGVDDCGDNSDELGCGSPADEKQVKIWLAAVIGVVCFLIGVVIAIAAPAIYKRCKYPNYSQLKDMMDPAIS